MEYENCYNHAIADENNLINMAYHVTEHARKLMIGLRKSNVWRDVFQHVYYAFEYVAL